MPARDITVVQLNLYRMRWRWPERARLVLDESERLEPDIVTLQEVAPFRRQAQWLARELSRRSGDGYRAFVTRKRGWRGLLEGIAILARLPATDFGAITLGDHRVAQRLVLEADGVSLAVVNTHFAAGGAMPIRETRIAQAHRITEWTSGWPGPLIVAGDLNARPASRTLAVFADRGLQSAFRLANGQEPPRTVPSFEAPRPGYVLDYILINDRIEVRSAEVVFDQPAPHDPALFASDHLGLCARLRLRP